MLNYRIVDGALFKVAPSTMLTDEEKYILGMAGL
jgi:hypothetical protein